MAYKCPVPPQDQSVSSGADVLLSASPTGTMPIRYLWQLDKQPIAAATDSALIIPAVSGFDEGRYSVVLSNAVAAVRSPEAVLGVAGTPRIFVNDRIGKAFTFTNAESIVVDIKSSFTNATSFYSLDGTPPTVYDLEGNMIVCANAATATLTSFHYDHRNRLVSVEAFESGGGIPHTV